MGRLPARPFLYPIVDVDQLAGRRLEDIIAPLCAAGARILQLRAKHVQNDREILSLACEAVRLAHRHDALMIINDRPDVAALSGADGVHLGQDDLAPEEARAILPSGAIVGRSTHSIEQLTRAAREAADYLAIGPVFATRSKESPDPEVGVCLLSAARAVTDKPLVAIGGIDLENCAAVVAAGIDGIAVIKALMAAQDLGDTARRFQARMRPGGHRSLI
ncbi:MAG: thiamine phosphate synthase [Vicinamibacteria bacterium]|jgi:thiamine-phosphate pyrophosphorylase|nr:thiamine phosphate synthase [Vicinamibacteria bacterium]